MERDTFDHQLFTWENWDQMEIGDLQFYDVTLKVQVGEFAPGTKFPAAFLIGSQSMLVLMDEKDQEHAYPVLLSTGEKIDPSTLPHAESCDCGHDHG